MRNAMFGMAAALFFQAGCASVDEQAAQVLATFGPYCDKLGYQPNTDAWRLCIQLEDSKAAAALTGHRSYYSDAMTAHLRGRQ